MNGTHTAPMEFGHASLADVEYMARAACELPCDLEPLAAGLLDVEHRDGGERGLDLNGGPRRTEVQREELVRRHDDRQRAHLTIRERQPVDDHLAGDTVQGKALGEQASDVGHDLVAGGGDVKVN